MPNMLALVASVEPKEGAWLRPQGRETGVKLYPDLGQGESVIIELEADPSSRRVSFALGNGFTPLPELAKVNRFRVVKSGSGTPTNVEVVRNGKAQRENRDAEDQQQHS